VFPGHDISNRDLIGAWQFGPNRVDFSPDGTYVLVSSTFYQDGTYIVTLGTRFGHGQWTSSSGYFLQLDPRKEEGKLVVPLLHQIEQLLPDALVLQSPLRLDDGTNKYPAVTCPRISTT
jgi:hypothetical protein